VTQEPIWLTAADAALSHAELIATLGGSPGIRDQSRLEPAMSRPLQVVGYDSQDLVVLAGAHAHAIGKNHPFVDGNKRVAFVIAVCSSG